MSNELSIPTSSVLNNLGGDRELLCKIAKLSLKVLPNHLAKVREAISCGEPHRIEAAAHNLKGSLMIFLCSPIIHSASQLEHFGKQGNIDRIRDEFSRLEELFPAFLSALEKLISDLDCEPENHN